MNTQMNDHTGNALPIARAYSIPKEVLHLFAGKISPEMAARFWLVMCPHCAGMHAHVAYDGRDTADCPKAKGVARQTARYALAAGGELPIETYNAWRANQKGPKRTTDHGKLFDLLYGLERRAAWSAWKRTQVPRPALPAHLAALAEYRRMAALYMRHTC
jgi:hypothetical protein